MATMNPFDLLGDDDNDDVSQLVEKIAAAPPKKAPPPAAAGKATAQPAKLPSKPLPPAQAADLSLTSSWFFKASSSFFDLRKPVREARNEGGRGGRGGHGYGRGGRGSGGFNRDSANNEGSFGNRATSGGQGGIEESNGRSSERRGGFRGGRQGSFGNGNAEDGERPRRTYGNGFKREGAGGGNWGAQADEINHEIKEVVVEGEKTVASDKAEPEEEASDVKKENSSPEPVEEPENKEMTLEEYQKVLEEKRKALAALKTEERKVEVDKDLASMQQLANKKTSDDIFVKLGSDKDKRKEIAEREERAKKSLSINEFLKPAEGERYYAGGRGRGRGGSRGGGRFNQGGGSSYAPEAPKIEDPSHFPTLGGK